MNIEIENLKQNSLTEVKTYYRPILDPFTLPIVKRSSQAYSIFLEIWDRDYISYFEQCYLLMLNAQSRVLAYRNVSNGGITGTLIDVRIVYQTALLCNATSIIIAHNHPSGRLEPSNNDLLITKKLASAGEILNIEFSDHLIISPNRYYSLSDNGLI